MNKIIHIFIITFSYCGMYAGIGAQFNIDNDVKALTAEQKTQEDTLKKSPSSSPKSILRKKNNNYVSSEEEGWVLGLLKCLQT